MFIYIIIGILMFGFLIFIHELGHFLVAKKCGVGIYEFAIGMGPKIFSHTGKDGVVYALRLFPIGGFVSMHGEDDDAENASDETSLASKSIGKRFAVISAGAVMNILLGLIVSFIVVVFAGNLYSTTVERFNFGDKNGNLLPLTEYQGLEIGDEIIKVGKRNINIRHDLIYEAMRIADKPVDLVVKRDGEKVIIKDFVFPISVQKGITFGNANFFMPKKLEKTIPEVMKQTFCQAISVMRMIWTSLIDTIGGKYGTEALAGPVGVVGEMKETAEVGGASALVFLFMVLTLNLGIINLLPLPALDGGRLFFLIIELIRGKPLNPRFEGALNFAGLMLLMLFMVFITVSDVARIF